MQAEDLVDTTEMYLKAVLELEEEGAVAMRARLAERFGHSGPTVQQTVSRMQRDDLLVVEADRQLRFTDRGRARAMSVMRKHRLAEVFLDRVIGLDWKQVHQEACRWEHVMSDRVEALLDRLLDSPETTPYGNRLAGNLPPDAARNLVKVATSREGRSDATIAWIGEPLQADVEALGDLHTLGLLPGRRVAVERRGPSILVEIDGEDGRIELPHEIAAHLFAVSVD
ncbi:DtxR family iron dependent repressor [Leifsonia xyli subsp. cynodontis DSM 46306]|uniref:HTH dtxR-type domain-containing protein n=1 Tax=Leifsonia xyli subsp. cynodontis DSM 46306 TaxID=1389489 RepID=U3PCK2_LEIXC|nr:metal-dependent transcriptional regulator [Leifsonia xyli]AGW42482.1 DtxR family iron dependent repressor [Leifsonia xyli subsp. cynodontis DSM 46306]